MVIGFWIKSHWIVGHLGLSYVVCFYDTLFQEDIIWEDAVTEKDFQQNVSDMITNYVNKNLSLGIAITIALRLIHCFVAFSEQFIMSVLFAYCP